MFRTTLSDTALRDLEDLAQNYRRLILTRIIALSQDPRPRGCKKLNDRLYRVRQGSYRILYEVNDREQEIMVMRIRPRREAYR